MNSNFNLDSLLARVEKPARYIGGQPNSCMNEVGEKRERFGVAFPDMYEIGRRCLLRAHFFTCSRYGKIA